MPPDALSGDILLFTDKFEEKEREGEKKVKTVPVWKGKRKPLEAQTFSVATLDEHLIFNEGSKQQTNNEAQHSITN